MMLSRVEADDEKMEIQPFLRVPKYLRRGNLSNDSAGCQRLSFEQKEKLLLDEECKEGGYGFLNSAK